MKWSSTHQHHHLAMMVWVAILLLYSFAWRAGSIPLDVVPRQVVPAPPAPPAQAPAVPAPLAPPAVPAVPAPLAPPAVPAPPAPPVVVTQVVTSEVQVVASTIVVVTMAGPSPSAADAPPVAPPIPVSSSSPSAISPSTTTDIVTVIETVTPPPVIVTLTAMPSTVTNIVTNPPTPAPTSASPTVWSAPAQITDLSCFNVSQFAYGQDNMAIVQGIPAEASATTPAILALATPILASLASLDGILPEPVLAPTWDNSSSAIQMYYPEGSINPGSDRPDGGADFYATPLDISQANNVSMEYSVFFPSDFDWALAGKLPGLYGGHTTCSGGDDALDCFSTRLMWRQGGAGELYLYAPKDKQTESLCSTPPLSVCDAAYGLSVARGAFNFTPGAWTHVRQTVALNTPGKQDGAFVLHVDNQEVIRRSDVFYRDVAPPPPPPPPPAPAPAPAPPATPPPQAPPSGGGGGIIGVLPLGPLGPLVGGLTGGLGGLTGGLTGLLGRRSSSRLRKRSSHRLTGRQDPFLISPPNIGMNGPAQTVTVTVTADALTQTATSETTATVTSTVLAAPTPPNVLEIETEDTGGSDSAGKPVGFTGLFFSTFFGGHEDRYASPKDQFTWFKDFSMTINN